MSSVLPTEIALASDGVLYVAVSDRNPARMAGRELFTGYALSKAELANLGIRRVLAWGVLGRLAIASDGLVYVDARDLGETRGRAVFRGFALTKAERERLVDSLHRMAASILVEARVG